MQYVYFLICSDGKPYTGCTDDLKDRLRRHNKGPSSGDKRSIAS